MDDKKCIGILLDERSDWIGGEYYLKTIIRALCTLEDKPAIYLLYRSNITADKFKEFKDSDLTFYRIPELSNKLLRFYNKITSFFKLYHLKYRTPITTPFKLSFVYPANFNIKFKNCEKELYWVPDFQELHFPQYFKKWEILKRKTLYELFNAKKVDLVFSSNSVKSDYENLFPYNRNSVKILNFRTILNMPLLDIYKNEHQENYFITCNQFWQHKNHKVIIEAAKIAIDSGYFIKFYFTGAEDKKNPGYHQYLKDLVKQYKLEETIYFLGFIDRYEQLSLMANANAVIQPSLFEGWNTSIEESKYVGSNLLVSDIAVHREQTEDYKIEFFKPEDPQDLFNKLLPFMKEKRFPNRNIDYSKKISQFAREIYNLNA